MKKPERKRRGILPPVKRSGYACESVHILGIRDDIRCGCGKARVLVLVLGCRRVDSVGIRIPRQIGCLLLLRHKFIVELYGNENQPRKDEQCLDGSPPPGATPFHDHNFLLLFHEEPGTVRGHLYQQNTLRDAFVAALSLNVFHKYADRLKMANIAQVVNVLQSMILTNDRQMVLTPTYYVFKMYQPHQDATYLPLDLMCEQKTVRDGRVIPMVSASASRDANGKIHVSLANVDLKKEQNVILTLGDYKVKTVSGEVLTAKDMKAYNSFEQPDAVKPQPFKGTKLKDDRLSVILPAKSIVVLEVE